MELYEQSTNSYEKLQLTRILLGIESVKNSVIRKFINETYHIENEFIFQLDPKQFDLLPEYIVKECDKIVSEINKWLTKQSLKGGTRLSSKISL